MRPTTRHLTALTGLVLVPALLAGCGDDDAPASAALNAVPAATSAATTPATATSASAPAPALPDALDATQASAAKGTLWGVYLTATEGTEAGPADAEAARAAKSLGYDTNAGDLGCDRGAPEALGLDPTTSYWSTSLLFRTQADAQAFVGAYDGEVVGTAEITVGCND